MTQDERWKTRYEEVVGFIEAIKRNPSKYVAEERLMVHFLKRGRKLLNAGELAEPSGAIRQNWLFNHGISD